MIVTGNLCKAYLICRITAEAMMMCICISVLYSLEDVMPQTCTALGQCFVLVVLRVVCKDIVKYISMIIDFSSA